MNKLLFSFVFFSVLFVIGCQENSITDPIPPESVNKVQTTSEDIIWRSIPLEGILVAHGQFNTYYSIQGSINYTQELFWLDPIPPLPQQYVLLNLSVNAVLTNTDLPGSKGLSVLGESEDIVYILENGINVIEKSFPIQGTTDGLVLMCRFQVTTDKIGLTSMWLSYAEDLSVN